MKINKNIIYKIVISLISILFFYKIINTILNFKNSINNITSMISIFSIIILLLISLILKNIKINKYYKYIIYPIIIFLLTFLIRIIFIIIIGENYNQVSDFSEAFKSGLNNNYYLNTYYSIYPHWATYPQFIRLILSIFQSQEELTIKISNIFFSATSSVLIYFIGWIISKKNISGIISSLIFAFYLPNIIYNNIVTPEHINITLLMSSFLVYILYKKNKKQNQYKYLFFISLLLVISNLFRPFGNLLLISIIIIELLEIIFYKKNIKIKIYKLLFLLFTYFIFSKISYIYLDYSIGKKVNRNIIGHALNAGLNSNCQGIWCLENSILYKETLEEEKYNFKTANKIMLNYIKKDLSQKYYKIPETINKKFKITWGDDGSSLYWMTNEDYAKKEISSLSKQLNIYIPNLLMFNYFTLIIITFISLIKIYKKYNKYFLTISLFLIGINIMFAILEAQSRYKSPIVPFIIILAGNIFINSKNKK